MCPTTSTIAPADALAANSSPTKNCPGCGSSFAAGGRGMGRVFCSELCRQSFNTRMKAEGGPMTALVKAWTLTRHAKEGTREAEICRFARSQITQIAGHWNDRDNAAGRPFAIEYVETLMASGVTFMDKH